MDKNLKLKEAIDKQKDQERPGVELLIKRFNKKPDSKIMAELDAKTKEILGEKPFFSYIYPKKISYSSLLGFFLVTAVLYSGYLLFLKQFNEKRFGILPKPKTSIKKLYEKNNRKKFYCIHCRNPLKITGKFICRAGHIPKRDRVVFKNCPVCDDIHNKIRCEQCGGEIDLYADVYCEEEILNRGKKYISRPVFEEENKEGLFIGGLLLMVFSIFLMAGLSYFFNGFHGGFFKIGGSVIFEFFADNYYQLYSRWNLNPFMIPIIIHPINIIVIVACYLLFPKKERVLENPYETQVL